MSEDDDIVCLDSPRIPKSKSTAGASYAWEDDFETSTLQRHLWERAQINSQSHPQPLFISIDDDDEDLLDIEETTASPKRYASHESQSSNPSQSSLSSSVKSLPSDKFVSQGGASSTATIATTGRYRVEMPKKRKKDETTSSARMEKKAEKEIQKEIKRLDKERAMEEKLRAKEVKKATSELQKSTKPGEALKYMTILLHPSLNERFDALTPQFVASEVKYEVLESPIENSISFKRELMQQGMGDDLKIRLKSKFVDEDQIIVLLDSDKVIPMIYSQLKGGSDCDIELVSWVDSIKLSCPGKKLTLFLYDLDKFFRKQKKNSQQEFRNRVLQAGDTDTRQPNRKRKINLPEISATEVQSCLIDTQLRTNISYRMIKNVAELGSILIQYTKGIADAPYKKQKLESQGFDWFALQDSAGSVKVEKDGTGLKKLWIDQIQQFNNVGIDMATAIANRYPSPIKLIEAYKACRNEDEGQSLLKDLPVTTGVGPLARTRKLPFETSKKFYRFFTSTNGDRFLGSTSDTR